MRRTGLFCSYPRRRRHVLDELLRDFRRGVRTLCRTPGFTVAAVVTLALGIGANTALFSIVGPLIERPLSIPSLDRVAAVGIGQKGPVAAADYFDWKNSTRTFSALAAYRARDVSLTGLGFPERLFAAEVMPDLFDVLQIHPALGRAPVPDEATSSGDRVAVLSYGLWQREFGADRDILGRTIDLDGRGYTVVGVMPKTLDFPTPTDVWLPLALDVDERARRDVATLRVVGRLAPSATMASAQAEMTAIARQLELAYPATNLGRRAHVLPLAEFVQGSLLRSALFLLLGIVAVVLLIACVNIAALQLVRGASRARELAIRTAIGATRARLLQMLFVENLTLALASGVAGAMIAWGLLRLLLHSMPGEVTRTIPGWIDVRLDGRSLAFAAAVALGCGIAAGLLPAWAACRRAPYDALKEGARGVGLERRRLRNLLAVGQIAVALALVATALFAIRGFDGLLRLGFAHDPDHVLVLSINLPQVRYADGQARNRFYLSAEQSLRALPGVESASVLSTIPLSNNGTHWIPLEVEGRPPPPGLRAFAVLQQVSANYFNTMRIGVPTGRALNSDDRDTTTPVVVVSRALAARYWPDANAIGKRIKLAGADATWLSVVGVADDVLYDWTDGIPEAVIYRPVTQAPPTAAMLAVRTSGDASALLPRARSALAAVDPLLPAFNAMTLRLAIDESLAGNPQIIGMAGLLASLASIIAVIGIYSLVAYAVTARTHEFGVRMALGASRLAILGTVLRGGLSLALIGIGIGLPLAIGLIRLGRGLFYGTGAGMFAMLGGIAGALAIVIVLACVIPARRAARVDPVVALRCE
jgi:putative ABC transport system permease protein